MASISIFYSWQSDLPGKTNRSFIEDALEQAVKVISRDDAIDVEPAMDRDTAGVPGAPSIPETIFAKIDDADVFVCDVSIINAHIPGQVPEGARVRLTPNPNVLAELGYALKGLGWKRILMVFNTAFGRIEDLPFDLNRRRVVTYHLEEAAGDRAAERKTLQARLRRQLDLIFTELATVKVELPSLPPLAEQARLAVEGSRQDQAALVRSYMRALSEDTGRASSTIKDEPDQNRWVDALMQEIERSLPLVLEFTHLAETIAIQGSGRAADALYQGFQGVLELYANPRGFSGSFYQEYFDFARFIGHELMVNMISLLLREQQWDILAALLDQEIYIGNRPDGKSGMVQFTYASQPIGILNLQQAQQRTKVASPRALLLKHRHNQGDLAERVPMIEFMEADYFLFLRGQLPPADPPQGIPWKPWSIVYMERAPRYLMRAAQRRYTEQLLQVLGLKDLQSFQSLLVDRHNVTRHLFHGFWDDPLSNFNPQSIGSR